MKIIRLGIGPMIGSSRLFFISLLGLRPGLFRCHTDLTDGTDFSGKQKYICHTEIHMSHRNSQKSRRSSSARLLPEGRKKVPSARAALRMRSENLNEFLRPSGSKRQSRAQRNHRKNTVTQPRWPGDSFDYNAAKS